MAEKTQTTKRVSHDEATQVALRLISGSFRRDRERLNNDKRPRFSIPTRVNEDDDCLIIAYIEQQEAAANAVWNEAVESCKQAAEDSAMDNNNKAAAQPDESPERRDYYYRYRGGLDACEAIESLKREAPGQIKEAVVKMCTTDEGKDK